MHLDPHNRQLPVTKLLLWLKNKIGCGWLESSPSLSELLCCFLAPNSKAATPSEHPAPKHQDISVREQQEQGCSLKEGEVGAKGEP